MQGTARAPVGSLWNASSALTSGRRWPIRSHCPQFSQDSSLISCCRPNTGGQRCSVPCVTRSLSNPETPRQLHWTWGSHVHPRETWYMFTDVDHFREFYVALFNNRSSILSLCGPLSFPNVNCMNGEPSKQPLVIGRFANFCCKLWVLTICIVA